MSIRVTDFKWERGKNDLEYIALLEKNRDAMMNNFRECSKIAKEQYNKGKADGIKEFAEQFKAHCRKFTTKSISDVDIDWIKDELLKAIK